MTPTFTRKRDTWLHRVNNADAVLMQPLDQAGADYLMGRLTRSQYEGLVTAAETALALLSPDSEELPS